MFTTTGLSFSGAAVERPCPPEPLRLVPAPSPSPEATAPDAERLLAARTDELLTAVPCAARPSTRFVHRDGPCRCFVGGPAPEFPPSAGVPVTAAS
ncbi:hypothetical protein N866_09620 [Actinotalea ferrariae CF5-4]|uniref:Uncharacterized protein n=1 Tax=Actinotalea ferrariae CF5-4 TaxID=948458 RepID=A0A021VMK6_9CELL|nr:hypothetical protein [Actinotalea ferrariae]EYR62328.1 hypothetical protein N866_09620 [Actinotalea ferrariae CF5-4]